MSFELHLLDPHNSMLVVPRFHDLVGAPAFMIDALRECCSSIKVEAGFFNQKESPLGIVILQHPADPALPNLLADHLERFFAFRCRCAADFVKAPAFRLTVVAAESPGFLLHKISAEFLRDELNMSKVETDFVSDFAGSDTRSDGAFFPSRCRLNVFFTPPDEKRFTLPALRQRIAELGSDWDVHLEPFQFFSFSFTSEFGSEHGLN
jgi:hypothetical protein